MFEMILTAYRFLKALGKGLQEKEFRTLFVFVLLLIVSGTVFYSEVEKWSILDAAYFCVTTLTTVGSNLHPATASGKIFTILYIFIGLGSVAAFVAAVAHHSKEQYPDIERLSRHFKIKK